MENNKNLDLEKSIELINNSFFSEAINLLKNLIKQNNSDFRAYYLLGSSYLKLKKLDLAEINLKSNRIEQFSYLSLSQSRYFI